MLMSQNAVELCSLLIEDNFGELFARIFSILQRYERLPFARLKQHSGLETRRLRHGLTAMIQQHLVFHFTSLQDNQTYYEANPHAAYYLVRSGKILNLVEDRLGEYAARIMETVLYLGHASVTHLENLPQLRYLKPPTPTQTINHEEEVQDDELKVEDGPVEDGPVEDGPFEDIPVETNGDHAPEAKPAPLHATLKTLASHGYLMRVRDGHFQSPSDNYLEAQRIAATRPGNKALKGKKQEEAIRDDAAAILEERLDADLSEKFMVNGLPRGIKRKFDASNSDEPPLTNGVSGNANGNHAEDEENDWSEDEDGYDNIPMDSMLVVQVNYEKLDVALRNGRFVSLAEQQAPPATTEVYEYLLRRIEYGTVRCRRMYDGRPTLEIPREGEEGDDFSQPPIEAETLVNDIDPNLDLSSAFAPIDSPTQLLNGRGKRPLENGINGDHDDSDEEGPNRAWEINQHLSLLNQAPFNLTTGVEQYGISKWQVNFRKLARKLRHLELERMIESRFGDVALRVVRVLQAKGKLDEKRLQEISFLPWKDMRQTLSSLQSAGYVDLQEVPKDAQRQPSKTIFLWYYDPDRVCSSVLEDTYKAMSRTLQRIRVERNRLKDFLDKTERSDVKGHEEEYLTEEELELLQRWKDKEALLLGEVARLDDMVAVFRDY